MGIVELYKDKANTLWQDHETFLCVFDDNGVLVAGYDFCTGLKLMQDDKNMTIFINDDDLVPGKWILFATKVNDDYIKHYITKTIVVDGFKAGTTKGVEFTEEYPWTKNWGHGKYVSRTEREERLAICSKCPLFDSQNIKCSVNEKIVLESTKYENEYCPEGKWGDKEKIEAEILENAISRGDIIIPQAQQIDPEEQADFEAEFEEYLKGL